MCKCERCGKECDNHPEACLCDKHAAETMPDPPFNQVDFIMDYEAGELEAEQIIDGFQQLINTGVVWNLQGSYGRMATDLIEAGHCHK